MGVGGAVGEYGGRSIEFGGEFEAIVWTNMNATSRRGFVLQLLKDDADIRKGSKVCPKAAFQRPILELGYSLPQPACKQPSFEAS